MKKPRPTSATQHAAPAGAWRGRARALRRQVFEVVLELGALVLLLGAAVSLLMVLWGPPAPRAASTHATCSTPAADLFHGTKVLQAEPEDRIEDDAGDGCDEDEALRGATSYADEALAALVLGLFTPGLHPATHPRSNTGAGRVFASDLFRPPQA